MQLAEMEQVYAGYWGSNDAQSQLYDWKLAQVLLFQIGQTRLSKSGNGKLWTTHWINKVLRLMGSSV